MKIKDHQDTDTDIDIDLYLCEMDHYKERLSLLDWHYQFSDDSTVYNRGHANMLVMRVLQLQLDPDMVIWNQYKPEGAI